MEAVYEVVDISEKNELDVAPNASEASKSTPQISKLQQ
tara:strand:- start:200 stop:313 length:114 start_codon:yes stop_codon:yes gene_type:complete